MRRPERADDAAPVEVNETKTRLARIPGDNITLLGYALGQFHGKEGRPYIGTRPSRKAVKSLLKRIHDRTARRWYADTSENTVADLSRLLRGWCGYFDPSPSLPSYPVILTTPSGSVAGGARGRARTADQRHQQKGGNK